MQSSDMVLNDVISHHANVTIERPTGQYSKPHLLFPCVSRLRQRCMASIRVLIRSLS